jgi:mono/diheme cytochrome c family protein
MKQTSALAVLWVASLGLHAACAPPRAAAPEAARPRAGDALHEQVLRGRRVVISHGCGGCHGGSANPASERWLAGNPADTLRVGALRSWPRNLTPDSETGLGRFSDRQIFNALRYGLRPSATPDVEITSAVPGRGNHPVNPDYLSPAMPWVYWRYMSDQELRDIAAYLKHGLKPVSRPVPDSERPVDLWASEFTVEKIGTHVLPPFPTAHEEVRLETKREQVLRGRGLVAAHACAACHGGAVSPERDGWLVGMRDDAAVFALEFQIGPFRTRPRNLTPDNTTGIGRFSERQIFNSLRFGLRPGETADVEITSTKPGEGNHPLHPKYLAPPMPWPSWRHMSDGELWDIAAYLKYGLKPVSNRVDDSEGPPDFWAGEYTEEKYGLYPAPPFPTVNERIP